MVAAAAWWFSSDAPPPSVEPTAVVLPQPVALPSPAEPAPIAAAPVLGTDAGHAYDAGGPIEVTLELFDSSEGHAAGKWLWLQSPPAPSDGRRIIPDSASATANVMGFAHLTLKEGVWGINDELAHPAQIEVTRDSAYFAIHFAPDPLPGKVGGIVVDERGSPVVGAEVLDSDPLPPAAREKLRGSPNFVRTSDQGRFELASFSERTLIARLGTRTSLPQVVSLGSMAARLTLFRPGWVRFEVTWAVCDRLFVQFEYLGQPTEFGSIDSRELAVPPGAVTFRARCISKGRLVTGYWRTDIEADAHVNVTFSMRPSAGLKVRVVDPHDVPLRGVAVTALDHVPPTALEEGKTPQSEATGTTNSAGVAELVPQRLSSYDPVYRVEVGGAWRNKAPTLARLGDQQLELNVVPVR